MPASTTTSRVSISPSTTYTNPAHRQALTTALLSSPHNSIPRIQATLLHELQASGWTAALRTYCLELLRSGECATFDEVMSRVLSHALPTSGEDETSERRSNGTHGVNGNGMVRSGPDGSGIRIPEKAVREGIKAVRIELEKVCDWTFE
ncbi:hypothetical protein BJ546DRAFT_836493 [Cryomyces antarcticus]